MADRDPNDLMDDGKVGRELAEAVQVDDRTHAPLTQLRPWLGADLSRAGDGRAAH